MLVLFIMVIRLTVTKFFLSLAHNTTVITINYDIHFISHVIKLDHFYCDKFHSSVKVKL